MSVLTDRQYQAAFYPAVDQRQALDDRQSPYYVPIYDRPELQNYDIVRDFSRAIEFSAGDSVHLLSGFIGSGKTSELLRLIGTVRATGRPAVFMDIEDFFNTGLPLNAGALPVVLAAGFISAADLPEQLKRPLAERFLDFLRRIEVEPTISADAANLGAEIKLSLRNDTSLIAQVSRAVTQNRRTFKVEFHDFFRRVSEALSPDLAPLFIVDSIDHFRGRAERFSEVRDSVIRAFTELADELSLPGVHVVYTVPIYLTTTPLGTKREMWNIKVALADGTPYEPGLAAMRDVLRARAPGGDTERLTGPHEDQMILQTGGLFRDLLRLTGQLIQTTRSLPAGSAEVGLAEMVLRNDLASGLSAEQVEILRDIRDTHLLTPRAGQWPDAMELMASGAILKYPNDVSAWFGVHPLLLPLL